MEPGYVNEARQRLAQRVDRTVDVFFQRLDSRVERVWLDEHSREAQLPGLEVDATDAIAIRKAGSDRVALVVPREIHERPTRDVESEAAQRLELKFAPVADRHPEIDRRLLIAHRRAERDRARRDAVVNHVEERGTKVVPVELQLERRLRVR